MLGIRKTDHVLMLQGPVGHFFARLARDLRERGARVTKINFNAGDQLFFRGPGAVNYRGRIEDWPIYLDQLLRREGVTVVLLFGDCRQYHRIAHWTAREMGIPVYVFEEGYLRPDHITVERDGVNGNSTLPRHPETYRSFTPLREPEVQRVASTFWHAAGYAIAYYLAARLGWPLFPHYRHHRRLEILAEAAVWLRSGWRKLWYRWREAGIEDILVTLQSKRYYLLPLQVFNDSQISHHSDYSDIEEFLSHVVASFALHAPRDVALVVKHHPMDRGYRDYARFIRHLARRDGLDGRLFYVHDLSLPRLLDHALGTVVVNSTVGISSLLHGTPVKTMGRALYDMPALTHQGSLEEFWTRPTPPEAQVFAKFRTWLLLHTQGNGSFYRRLPGHPLHCGVTLPRVRNPVSPYAGETPSEPDARAQGSAS